MPGRRADVSRERRGGACTEPRGGTGWATVGTLPAVERAADDREPAVIPLFLLSFAKNRTGQSALAGRRADRAADVVAPCACAAGDDILLWRFHYEALDHNCVLHKKSSVRAENPPTCSMVLVGAQRAPTAELAVRTDDGSSQTPCNPFPAHSAAAFFPLFTSATGHLGFPAHPRAFAMPICPHGPAPVRALILLLLLPSLTVLGAHAAETPKCDYAMEVQGWIMEQFTNGTEEMGLLLEQAAAANVRSSSGPRLRHPQQLRCDT